MDDYRNQGTTHMKIIGSIMTEENKLKALRFNEEHMCLEILDQTLLPQSFIYRTVPNSERGYYVIKTMMVRGAPVIAAVACLSIVSELNDPSVLYSSKLTYDEIEEVIKKKSKTLISSRPTAVNMKNALGRMLLIAAKLRFESRSPAELVSKLTKVCLEGVKRGENLNKMLGEHGAEEIMSISDRLEGVVVLTHCNTGSLATVGYGTALGVIRSLRNRGALKQAYITETRPYNQGSRLTAWELVTEKMPGTLIADSMVAYLMTKKKINAVLVGADCVAANGDTANKIGTLQIAVTAKYYKVPFYVCAPTQSIDMSIENQSKIKIELRPSAELRKIEDVFIAPEEVDVWNPCFDVTPSELITAIITEHGICKPDELANFMASISDRIKTDLNSIEY